MIFGPVIKQDKLGREVILRNAEMSDAGRFPDNMKYADGTSVDACWMMKKLII